MSSFDKRLTFRDVVRNVADQATTSSMHMCNRHACGIADARTQCETYTMKIRVLQAAVASSEQSGSSYHIRQHAGLVLGCLSVFLAWYTFDEDSEWSVSKMMLCLALCLFACVLHEIRPYQVGAAPSALHQPALSDIIADYMFIRQCGYFSICSAALSTCSRLVLRKAHDC